MRKIQILAVCALFAFTIGEASAQVTLPATGPLARPAVEKVGDNLFRVGSLRVDTAKHEVSLPGKVNDTQVLEFIANTKNGFRAYESAFELESDGVTFNLAMILIGLDKANSVLPRFHFDPNPPVGDPVEVWIEWKAGDETKRMRADEILWDKEKKQAFPRAQWVYTGSYVQEDGRYMADSDAVLIGFVHDRSSIIEWTGSNGVGRFGNVVINPSIGLLPGMPITLIVKATKPPKKD